MSNRVTKRIVSLTLAGCAAAGAVAAQEVADTVRLPEVVVTAARMPLPRDLVTAPVVVLEGEVLRAEGVTYVADALRRVAGLHVARSGSYGAVTSVFLRGGQSDYLKVLVDGVPLNEPGGAVDLANLTVHEVERIEILRGPASVLYGSDAVAGVVQIFTRRGRGPASVNLLGRAGSFGTVEGRAVVQGGTARAGYALEAQSLSTDGILPFNNRYVSRNVTVRLHAAPDEATEAAVMLRYFDGRFHFPTDAAGQPVDSNQHALTDATTLGVELRRRFAGGLRIELSGAVHELGGGIRDTLDYPGDTLDSFAARSQRSLHRRIAEARAHYDAGPQTVVSVGAAVEQQREQSWALYRSGYGDFETSGDHDRWNVAGYAQLVTRLADRLSVNAGLRRDENERFGGFWTGRGGAAVDLPWAMRITAGLGNAFKEPTFIENFGLGFVAGNPALRPERAWSWEAGVRQRLWEDRVVLAATYFGQRFRDVIEYLSSPDDPFAFQYVNVAAARAGGLEIEAAAELVKRLEIEAAYTYLRTRVTRSGTTDAGAEFRNGERLLRRPDHSVTATLRWRPDTPWPWTANVQARYVGPRDDLDFATFPAVRRRMPGFAVFDVGGEVRLTPRAWRSDIWLAARVENLFDRRYQEVLGFQAPGRGTWIAVRVGR